jgi:CDP-diacylglycerol--serine O-phosphatidyltransferase
MAFMKRKRSTTVQQQMPYRPFFAGRIRNHIQNRRRLKKQTVTAMIPNLLTVMAMCSGMTAIRFALLEKWELAIVSILVSAILDTLDGRLARLLNSSSRFGAELDSFADFLSFGIAPALMMYLKGLQHWGELGWAITLFFAICIALRLARFNVMSIDDNRPAWMLGFFTGVPSPLGGFLGVFPLVLDLAIPGCAIFSSTALYAFCMLGSALLMVSRIPTFSLKKVTIPPSRVLVALLVFVIAIGGLYSYPWQTLALFGVFYLGSIPFSYRRYQIFNTGSNQPQ